MSSRASPYKKKERKTCNPHFNYFASPYTLKLSTHTHTHSYIRTCVTFSASHFILSACFCREKFFPAHFGNIIFIPNSNFPFASLFWRLFTAERDAHTHTHETLSPLCVANSQHLLNISLHSFFHASYSFAFLNF